MSKKTAILFFLIISIITILYSYVKVNVNCYLPIAISVCVELVAYYFVNRIVKSSLLNFSVLFITLVFFFHFGQLLLLAFFQDMIELFEFRIVVSFFTDEQSCYAFRVMNIAFVSVALGTLLPSANYKQRRHKYNSIDYYSLSKKIILLTFPIKIVIDIYTVYLSFTVGFVQASYWLQKFPNFIRSYGNISMVGFGLLIVALANKPQQQKKVFISVLLYLAVLMLSGWRSENVAYLTAFAYLYLSTRPHIKLKNIVIYAVVGYFVLCFVQVVGDMREASVRSVGGYSNMLSSVLFGGGVVFLDSLRELGNTGYTAECVLVNWLNHYDPSWGKSYVLGLSAIFPNITGLAGQLAESASFATQLQKHNMILAGYYNIGGSVLGEFFFNFGILGGVIFAFFMGKLIGWFSDNSRKSLISGQYYFLFFAIPVMFATLYWVRDSFGHLIRDVVWGILLCIVIVNTSKKSKMETIQ